jgi:protein-disulfide isomerase
MKSMKLLSTFACAAALLAISGCHAKQNNEAAPSSAPVNYSNTKPPAGGDWTDVINATPDGGVMMGDPNAKVHLIEIGSLTCPHCQHFEEQAADPLINNYVKTGKISFEFRNYIRDSFDLAAVLIAKCNGPEGFFPLTRAFYDTQPQWVGKIQATPQAQLEQLQSLPENQIELQAAKFAGLLDWAAARGVPQAKATQCLTDTKAIDAAVNSSGAVTNQWPSFPGTPSFVLNGTMIDLTSIPEDKVWATVEAKLKGALGS